MPDGHTMDSFLRTIVWFGAQQRYAAISSAVKRQLEKELALIQKLGFPGYFLIVWDIVNFCREHNVMVQGRGSAANSRSAHFAALRSPAVRPTAAFVIASASHRLIP